MSLREDVTITVPGGTLSGYLFVGAGGLPEVRLNGQLLNNEDYTPALFPAAWSLRYSPQEEPPILYAAWRAIEDIRQQIVDAQWLQAEQAEADNDKERSRESATDNRIAQEIDERREDARPE